MTSAHMYTTIQTTTWVWVNYLWQIWHWNWWYSLLWAWETLYDRWELQHKINLYSKLIYLNSFISKSFPKWWFVILNIYMYIYMCWCHAKKDFACIAKGNLNWWGSMVIICVNKCWSRANNVKETDNIKILQTTDSVSIVGHGYQWFKR